VKTNRKRPVPGLDPGTHVFFCGRHRYLKTWMPTDQVRGLKAHGTSPAKGHLWFPVALVER
jgi:hypothetical protein